MAKSQLVWDLLWMTPLFAFSTYAIAAMISPFFVGMVADRFFSTERLLSILHFIGAGLFYLLSITEDYQLFFVLLLAYNLVFMPTITLTNSLSFHHILDREKQFPTVRVFGTIAWIVAGYVLSGLDGETNVLQLQLAMGVSILMGIYCFFLPHTPPKGKDSKVSVREILGLDALALMKQRSFATVLISSFLVCIPLAFYYANTHKYLTQLEVSNAAALQTWGQVSEALFLLLLPLLFVRLGMKKVMAIGMAAWAIRYILFAFGVEDGNPVMWMILVGIVLHGICYDFFFVAGQIFVDQKAPDKIKGAAQGLITFATYGLGLFVGTIFAAKVFDSNKLSNEIHDWYTIWIIPAVLAAIVLVGFLLVFKEEEKVNSEKDITSASN